MDFKWIFQQGCLLVLMHLLICFTAQWMKDTWLKCHLFPVSILQVKVRHFLIISVNQEVKKQPQEQQKADELWTALFDELPLWSFLKKKIPAHYIPNMFMYLTCKMHKNCLQSKFKSFYMQAQLIQSIPSTHCITKNCTSVQNFLVKWQLIYISKARRDLTFC